MAFALGLGLVAALPADDKPSPEKVAGLIEKLGSSDFTEREKANKDLQALGEFAYDGLKKASQSEDLETRRRAEELLKKVEAKVLAKKVLEPTKIQLTFKDTPLPEAIAEVQKKTGLNISLNDPQNKLADRKVTLETGEKPMWEAVDLFIQKAGLVEAVNPNQVPGTVPLPNQPVLRPGIKIVPRAVPAPVQDKDVAPALEQPKTDAPANDVPQKIEKPVQAVQVQAVRVQVAQVQVQAPAPPPPPALPVAGKPGRPPVFPGMMPNTLILSDGKESLPTHYAGAVRIRALPVGTAIPGFAPVDGEVVVPLQVTAEPKIQVQSLLGVKIEKAIDDQDQGLTQAMLEGGNNEVPVANNGLLLAKAAFVARPNVMPVGVAPIPVRLKKGEKGAKALKELTGTVSMQVRSAPEDLMTIEKLMDAAGKEAKAEGGRMKVLDVSKTDKGITLKVEFEQPQDVQGGGIIFQGGPVQIAPLPAPVPAPAPVPPQFQNGQIQVQVQVQAQQVQIGRLPVRGPGGVNGLVVQDEKGQPIPMNITQSQAQGNGQTVVWQYTFQVTPQKDQGEPAKLVYQGSRLQTVEVPFTLKNVPLQ